MKKRLLSTLLALCMVLSLLPGTAWAAENQTADVEEIVSISTSTYSSATSGTCGDNVYWNFNENTGTLTISGTGQMDDYANYHWIDTEYGHGSTIEVDSSRIPWYANRQAVKSIIIESGVTSIGICAFYESGATNVSLPESIISIGAGAFLDNKSLTEIAIPASVKNIDAGAFHNCTSLANIIFSGELNSIGVQAFADCTALTKVVIPGTVERICAGAFERCAALTDVTFLNGIARIGSCAFFDCSSLTSLTIPTSVVCIESRAFDYCKNLTDIYYGGSNENWRAIERDQYGSDSNSTYDILLNATIHYNSTGPDDVDRQTISGILRSGEGWSIRWECTYSLDANGNPQNGRVEITASESNVREELYLYNDASADGFPWELAPYNIPKSAITSLSIQGSITKKLRIAANSFTGYDNLRTVALNGVSGIDSNAFYGCSKLEQIALMSPDETLARIGDGAFKDCTSLSKIEFPGALTNIGAEAFRNTALGDITLWKNLEEIGENAFADCPNLKISCYENSVAHRHAVENSIPFQLITEPDDTSIKATPIQFHLGEAGQITMSIDWGWKLFDSSSSDSKYGDQLSAMGLALSSAAEHSESEGMSLLDTLGFEEVQSKNYGKSWKDILYPGVLFGHKKVNDVHYFAIVVRGTNTGEPEDFVTDINGFIVSSRNLYTQLNEFIQIVCQLDLSEIQGNCKFFVTGHSLGGATANVLAKTLSDNYDTENVFAYTFAPPRPIDAATGVLNSDKYNNIHNIVNLEDGWPRLPPTALFTRYGKTTFFHRKKTDKFYENFLLLTGREFDKSISAHDTAVYMSFVLSNQTNGSIRVIRCACPVDIEIYDSDGLLVGRVKDNVVSGTESEKVYICVEETEKYLYLLVDDDYTIKMIGTDEGTMTYSVHELDMDGGETTDEIIYEDVNLAAGKQMRSNPSVTDISQVPLYVLDGEGNPMLKVLPDGKGTEVPLDSPNDIYTVSFDTTVISLKVPSMKTNTEGKLSSLPKPTRNGYNFDGWFTAASGGSQITTETVFDRNTTVYAHWTYVGGGSTTNPGNPNYYPDSGYWDNYTPPTYAITVPSPANGMITVSPKFASKGSTVTITVAPDTGYQLAVLTVSDGSGKAITLTDKGNGKYTFTMPSGKVTVDATFQPIQVPETPWNNPFTDVAEGEWYYEAVRFVQENGLMSGYGNGTFAPNANLSRAMLAQILYNKEGRPTATGSNFTDVTSGTWYADAVAWAAAQGIVSGYGNGLFGPNDNITREQLAVMLWRYAGGPAATDKELHFNDADTASGYAVDALRWAVENGVINGKGGGILDPKGQATRAQVAQMLMNYLKK